jgi:amino acid transporter
MTESGPEQPAMLSRQLGPTGMLFTGLGIIGSGWLFAALYTAQIAGPAGIISWLIGGAFTMVIALVYAELGTMFPVGGALCWIAFVSVAPIEVIAVLDYASNYLPSLTIDDHGERVLTLHGVAVAIAMLTLFTVINIFGVRIYARTNAIVTVWKVIIPLSASILLILVGFRWENLYEFGGFAPTGISGIFGAVSGGGVVFAYLGFRNVLDMAGEARNPQRDIPFAVIGTLGLCMILYLALQIAFIGVVPPAHLSNGWAGVTESAAGGPFAAIAILLGLHWLAVVLYADAIMSPSGTALAFMATTARLNYSLARAKQAPARFERLNRHQVPAWGLLFNFVVGVMFVLPLPGWNEIVGFITTTSVLSFAFGPISLVVLRRQDPHRPRPFRIPAATVFSATTLILIGFIVYWTGWQTNWKIFLLALVGVVIFAISRLTGLGRDEPLQLRAAAWVLPYYVGLAAVSCLGNYGGGLGVLPSGIDMAIIAVFSLAILWLAVKLRLAPEVATRLVATAREEMEGATPRRS